MSANLPGVPMLDYGQLARTLAAASPKSIYKVIVEAPFKDKVNMAFLFLGFICLYIVDEEEKQIQLKAASGTEEYRLAVEWYNFKPADFHLDFDTDKNNTIVKAIASGKPQETDDWVTVSRQHSSPEVVRLNQANSGIAYTAIQPFSHAVRGALMYNFYQYPDKIDGEQRTFMRKYTDLVSSLLSQAAS